MPLATRPAMLAKIIGKALAIPPPTMLNVKECTSQQPWFIGFEWIGRKDYLNEAGKSKKRARGANCTSADAVVRFEHAGHIETLLIEWKYTERYGAPIPPSGNHTRVGRYKNIVFAPNGPIRSDLGLSLTDFFWEPFYQLLRQQMLAFQMQAAHEDQTERVRVLHISPTLNLALRNITAPALQASEKDAFTTFKNLLVQPDDFISCSTNQVFATAIAEADGDDRPWADYLSERYSFLGIG